MSSKLVFFCFWFFPPCCFSSRLIYLQYKSAPNSDKQLPRACSVDARLTDESSETDLQVKSIDFDGDPEAVRRVKTAL